MGKILDWSEINKWHIISISISEEHGNVLLHIAHHLVTAVMVHVEAAARGVVKQVAAHYVVEAALVVAMDVRDVIAVPVRVFRAPAVQDAVVQVQLQPAYLQQYRVVLHHVAVTVTEDAPAVQDVQAAREDVMESAVDHAMEHAQLQI